MPRKPETEEEKNVGTGRKKFGIDKYLVFDEVKNEITMEIPMSELMNPEENKKIREVKRSELVFDKEQNKYVYK